MTTKASIHVAAAIIWNDRQQILLSLRDKQAHQGGKWEFPGGKVETGESPRAALQRELKEELAIQATEIQDFLQFSHTYPDLQVVFDIFEVTVFEGRPTGLEGQDIAWFELDDLNTLNFPEANYRIVQQLMANQR